MPILATQNICFSYGMVQALRDVTMKMVPGQITCVMGRNGVGKTTLLKNIMGIASSTSGAVQVNGKVRGHLEVPVDTPREVLEKLALANDKIQPFLTGKQVVKIVVVPGRLVNIVVK